MILSRRLFPSSIFALPRYSIGYITRLLSITQSNKTNDDDNLQENPFYDKYESKIKKLKESGIYVAPKDKYSKILQRETQSWKHNLQKLENNLVDKKKTDGKISGLKLPRKLDELIRMDLLIDKSADEISKIWTKYWCEKENTCAVIPKDVFDSMVLRAKECPLFLYPLPRSHGYEFFLSQFNEHHCFYTPLISYQVHGEDAPWQLCFKFYPELGESKDIVLMASEFDSNALNVSEVQCLAQLQQLIYANPSEKRAELLRIFNHSPDTFKYMDVVKGIESSDFIVKV